MLFDANDHRTKLALQHAADGPLRQGEDRVGLVLVEHRVLGHLADVGVFGFQASLLDEVVETDAGLELGLGRLGVALVGKQDLLQVALLGRAELGILAGELLIGGLGVGVAHFGGIGDRVRLERQNGHSPVFGRAVARLAIVVEGLERLLGGRGNVARGRSRQEEIIGRAGLALIIGFRFDLGLGRRDPRRQRGDNELPEHLLAQLRDEAALAHIHVAQRAGEAGRVEGARLVAEVLVRGDDLAQRLVGNVEAELVRLVVDRRFAQQLLEDAAVEADLAGLLVGERSPQPALILLNRSIVGDTVFLGGDFRSADRGDGGGREPAQHVAHAPDDEADDDEPHDHGHDRLADDP